VLTPPDKLDPLRDCVKHPIRARTPNANYAAGSLHTFRKGTNVLKRRTLVWILVGVCVVVGGKALQAAGFYAIAPLPLVTAAVAAVIANKGSRLLVAVGSALFILLLAESALSPGSMVTTAPLWASLVLVLGLAFTWRQLRLPRSAVLMLLLCGGLVLPTLAQGDMTLAAKATGIVGLWFLIYVAAAHLTVAHRAKLLVVIVGAGCVEATLAVFESLLKWEAIRTYVTANASDGYIVRPNVILGDWTNRAQGTIGYAIPFGAFIVLAILIVVFGGVVRGRGWKAAIVGLLSVAILLAGARSAIAALAFGLGIGFVFTVIRARRMGVRVPGLKGMIIALTGLVAAGLVFFVRAIATRDFSLAHRGGVVESAVNMIDLPPLQLIFGSGYHSADKLFESGILHTDGERIVDNTLLTQLIFAGLVGLVLLIAVVTIAFVRSPILGKAVLAAVFTLFFFYDLASWHLSMFVVFLFVGFASSPSSWRSARNATEIEKPLGLATKPSGEGAAKVVPATPSNRSERPA